MVKFFKIVLLIVLVIYIVVNLAFFFYQEKLIFLDTQLADDHVFLFKEPFEEVLLNAADGGSVHALHFKAEQPKGIIVYQHGNAGDLERWGNIGEKLIAYNYDVLIWDYRGYGKSKGKRSQKTLLSDAQLVYSHAQSLYGEPKIIVYGRSLGTGISTYLASTNSPKKLILETPYYSLQNLVNTEYAFLITKRFLRYPLHSNEYAKEVTCPALIFHGTADEVVKYSYGEKLFGVLATADKEMVTLQGGHHNDLATYATYWEKLEEFLSQ